MKTSHRELLAASMVALLAFALSNYILLLFVVFLPLIIVVIETYQIKKENNRRLKNKNKKL